LLIVFTQAEAVWPPLYLGDICQVNTVIIQAFISDLDEPGIWDESPAFEIVLEHILDSQSNYSESSYDLLERFQEVIHTAEPVYLALEATLENVGGGGSYSGRFTVEVLDIRYAGHKEL